MFYAKLSIRHRKMNKTQALGLQVNERDKTKEVVAIMEEEKATAVRR